MRISEGSPTLDRAGERQIVMVGLNHRSAPIELRERLAFRDDQLSSAFGRLRRELGIQEAAILSTCNRVEVYAAAPEPHGTLECLQQFLSEHGAIELPRLSERLYHRTEPESVRHLFSVASGLDSMILGEAEILHQVKRTYELARQHDATGKVFNALFQRALNTAKTVRSQTGIGRGCTSVGTVAIDLASKIFGDLRRATVLLVGAGKIGELTLGRLAGRGVRQLRIMNRSMERAQRLAQTHQALPLALEQLPGQLLEADIIISSTSAPTVMLHRAEVAAAMHGRRQRPLCIIDLGVPRNVQAAVGTLENVYLFNIDDLQDLAAQHQAEREHATKHAQGIIDQKVDRFVIWRHREGMACVPSSLEPVAAP